MWRGALEGRLRLLASRKSSAVRGSEPPPACLRRRRAAGRAPPPRRGSRGRASGPRGRPRTPPRTPRPAPPRPSRAPASSTARVEGGAGRSPAPSGRGGPAGASSSSVELAPDLVLDRGPGLDHPGRDHVPEARVGGQALAAAAQQHPALAHAGCRHADRGGATVSVAQRVGSGQLVRPGPERPEALPLPLGPQGVAWWPPPRSTPTERRGGPSPRGGRARAPARRGRRGSRPAPARGGAARLFEPRIEKGRSRGLSQLNVSRLNRGRVAADRCGEALVEGRELPRAI